MTDCMFLAGDDCPATRELADMDRQINMRLKAESEIAGLRKCLADQVQITVGLVEETKRLREALRSCASHAGYPDAAQGCRFIIKIAREALKE